MLALGYLLHAAMTVPIPKKHLPSARPNGATVEFAMKSSGRRHKN
jgi:hypothetical protein